MHSPVSGALVVEKEIMEEGKNYEAGICRVFCLGGLDGIQEILVRGGKDLLHSHYELQEDPPLL
jgi:hypothetical protein